MVVLLLFHIVAVYEESTNELVYCDVDAGTAASNTVSLTFATAPTTNEFRVVVIG
jgi:hypothetical protein